jgi:hypothetical protein
MKYRFLLNANCGFQSITCIDGGVVLGFGALWFRRSMPAFRRNMLSPSPGLK